MAKKYLTCLSLLFFVILLSGCSGSTLIGDGPVREQDPDRPTHGIRYFLAKDMAAVTVSLTTRTTREVMSTGLTLDVVQTQRTTADGRVAFRSVPDQERYFFLDLEPGRLREGNLRVELQESGLLGSVGATSTSRTGDALTGAVRFGSTVLTAAMSLPFGTPGLVGESGMPHRPLTELCSPQTSPYSELPSASNTSLLLRREPVAPTGTCWT